MLHHNIAKKNLVHLKISYFASLVVICFYHHYFVQNNYKMNRGKTAELLQKRQELLEERRELSTIPIAALTEATTRKVL